MLTRRSPSINLRLRTSSQAWRPNFPLHRDTLCIHFSSSFFVGFWTLVDVMSSRARFSYPYSVQDYNTLLISTDRSICPWTVLCRQCDSIDVENSDRGKAVRIWKMACSGSLLGCLLFFPAWRWSLWRGGLMQSHPPTHARAQKRDG